MFEIIKRWFRQGLWSSQMVKNAVTKGVLTEEQANEILLEEEE